MKKYLIFFALILTIISCQNNANKNEVKPKINDITESVYASVKVIPKIFYNAQPLRAGIIDSIFVNEGALVKKDQILFQIIPNTDVNSQLTEAQISLSEATSNYLGENGQLNSIQLEIETAKAQLNLDYINLKRQERLLEQNIGKKLDYDQIKLKYENTKNQVGILEQKFAQTKNTLNSNYQKAQNRSKTGKIQIEDFTVRAQIDGKIYSVNKEEGDFISAQEKFAEIGTYDLFKIEMDIDEVDITKINLGDTVIIILDAYKNELFLATVSKIFPKKNDISQTFRVESKFVNQPPKLYYGLAGEGNIVIAKRKNVLVIPTEYLLPNNKVMTSEGEKTVTVGMKNLEFVEILSGIDTNTNLIKTKE